VSAIGSFVRLDLHTVKAYKKSMYPLVLVAVVMAFFYRNATVFGSILMMGLVIFASFPFAVAEKNGIDTLYATLALTRRGVVAGRYAFAAFLGLAGIAVNLLLSAVAIGLSRTEMTMGEAALVIGVMASLYVLVVACQYPIYFRWGYTKGKLRAYVPLLLFPLAIGLSGNLGLEGELNRILTVLSENPALLFAAVLGEALVLLTLSCALSGRLYEKREF